MPPVFPHNGPLTRGTQVHRVMSDLEQLQQEQMEASLHEQSVKLQPQSKSPQLRSNRYQSKARKTAVMSDQAHEGVVQRLYKEE